jgi:hypothetical protein
MLVTSNRAIDVLTSAVAIHETKLMLSTILAKSSTASNSETTVIAARGIRRLAKLARFANQKGEQQEARAAWLHEKYIGSVPSGGLWRVTRYLNNQINVNKYQTGDLHPHKHLPTVKVVLAQGAVLIIERWKTEVDEVVSEIELVS